MTHKLTWNDYLDRLPGGPSDRQIAKSVGANPSTVLRWRRGQDPNPRHAVEIARAHKLHPFTALVAAGYLTTDELDQLFGPGGASPALTLDSMPTVSLLEEAIRRVEAAGA